MIYPHVRNRPSYTFTTGFGTLTRGLAEQLDVRLNTRVLSIELGDDCEGRNVICEGPQGRQRLSADIVVCALPGSAVAGVVADQTPWEKSFFADVPYAQYAMVAYVLKNKPAMEFDIRTFHTRPIKRRSRLSRPSPVRNGRATRPACGWCSLRIASDIISTRTAPTSTGLRAIGPSKFIRRSNMTSRTSTKCTRTTLSRVSRPARRAR